MDQIKDQSLSKAAYKSFILHVYAKQHFFTKMLENIPMKKFGDPSDVAKLVYFLSSDDASYITGQNFHVNGGMLMV